MQTIECYTQCPSGVELCLQAHFLKSTPCKEPLAPGKLSNQQPIPGLGTHGRAFNQSSSAQDAIPLHFLIFLEKFSGSFKIWPKFSTAIIVSKPYLAMLEGSGHYIHNCFPPSDFIFHYSLWPSFYSLAMPSLRAFPLALPFA